MKNIDLQSPDLLIHDTCNETDHLSVFLQEYAHDTLEQPDPDHDMVLEIRTGIKKLNGILEGLNLPERKTFMSGWITPERVKLKLGISERTLADWRKTGKLPYTRIENKFYYKNQDLENLLLDGYHRNKKKCNKP